MKKHHLLKKHNGTYVELVFLYESLSRREEAIAAAEKAEEAAQINEKGLRRFSSGSERVVLSSLELLFPSNEARSELMVIQSANHAAIGNRDKAIESLERALRLYPANPTAVHNMNQLRSTGSVS